jgi:hypothetical protein
MNTIIFEGAAFNADVIAKQTEADFIKSHTGQKIASTDLTGDQLKEVHALAVKTVAAAPKVEVKPEIKVIPAAQPAKPEEKK